MTQQSIMRKRNELVALSALFALCLAAGGTLSQKPAGTADSPVELSGEPRHHPKFENEFVRVLDVTVPAGRQFNAALAEWFELRGSVIAAQTVACAAAARCESRGAHQREDFPDTDPAWARSQRIAMTRDGALIVDGRQ